ncbi:hypothetical protein HG530_000680 [Fusarium avenaceum]|nr:hypothetical protein HG530_000680 [Fusarium avenaceum]
MSGSGTLKLTAEAHGEVGTSPEKVGQATTTGNVAVEPRDISDSLLATNVGERALVRVTERLDILDSAELSLEGLNLSGDLGRVALLEVQAAAELLDASLLRVSLGHVVEQTSQERTLLGSDLSGRGVTSDGAVTDSPDVASSLDNEVLIDGKTTTRVLLSGNLAHKITDNRTDSVTSGPDKQTVGDAESLLATIGSSELGLNKVLCHPLDHGLELDVDVLLAQGVLGVLDELLGERGENVGKGLDKSDLEAVADLGNQLLDVFLEEVAKLSGELDTGRSTTNNDHVHQTVDLLLGLALERSALDTVHNLLANSLGITNLLKETAVLTDTRNTESGVLGTDTNDKQVIGDLGLGLGTLALSVVLDLDNLAIRVNGGSLSFVGGEEEVVARGDDDDVVVLGVEVLEETNRAPAGS